MRMRAPDHGAFTAAPFVAEIVICRRSLQTDINKFTRIESVAHPPVWLKQPDSSRYYMKARYQNTITRTADYHGYRER